MTESAEFIEVADRVWVARHEWFDVNVGLIAGERGLVVIDTNASSVLGNETLAAVRRVSSAPLLAAVNTHLHFDHVLGNGVFAAAGAELVGHELAAAGLADHIRRTRAAAGDQGDTPRIVQNWADLVATEPVAPTRTFSSALTLDLGDRIVELIHPGRGHTDGDIVVHVPDAQVLLAGDLVEESALGSPVPGFGSDCYPMEWPLSLDLMLSLITDSTVVIPGHGAPVDKDFVWEQRAAIGVVAETIRDLAGRGIPLADALAAGDWPYPREDLADAVRRGYEQLPRAQKRLPLV